MRNKVWYYRNQRGLTLQQLSKLTGLSVAAISKIENDNTNDILLKNAIVLSRALKVDMYELFCISNIVYIETHEGMTTDELGILVMRLFYQFNCTDLVLDTNGQGIGVYDFIIKPQYDAEYGVTYEAMTCINDDNMADRCKIRKSY